jgi:hypothetical protein
MRDKQRRMGDIIKLRVMCTLVEDKVGRADFDSVDVTISSICDKIWDPCCKKTTASCRLHPILCVCAIDIRKVSTRQNSIIVFKNESFV